MAILSKLGIGAGLIFAIYSSFRYFIQWYDLDRLIAYVGMGLLWAMCFWIFGRIRDMREEMESTKKTLTSFEDRFLEYKENLEEKGITELT